MDMSNPMRSPPSPSASASAASVSSSSSSSASNPCHPHSDSDRNRAAKRRRKHGSTQVFLEPCDVDPRSIHVDSDPRSKPRSKCESIEVDEETSQIDTSSSFFHHGFQPHLGLDPTKRSGRSRICDNLRLRNSLFNGILFGTGSKGDEWRPVPSFDYMRVLRGHHSCVNALAFSRGDGRWLASGGDDTRIHIRDMFNNIDMGGSMPVVQLYGHSSNIFSLAWSAQNKHLFSGANDEKVLHYDLEHSPFPIRSNFGRNQRPRTRMPHGEGGRDSIASHSDSVREVSTHPFNPSVLLSCCDSGELQLLDVRLKRDKVGAERFCDASCSSVQFNPSQTDGNTFAVATLDDRVGSTRLYDVRKCFGTSGRPLSSKDALIEYDNVLTHRDKRIKVAETNSVQFDPSGRLLASSVSMYKPTIYAVGDASPILTLSTESMSGSGEWNGSNEERTCTTPSWRAPKGLCSVCTVKHSSFGLEKQTGGRLIYVTGSDDFRCYGFEIPEIEVLKRRREVFHYGPWAGEEEEEEEGGWGKEEDVLYMSRESLARRVRRERMEGKGDEEVLKVVKPVEISRPSFTLEGGQSIINVALIHPTMPLIATSGIERVVRIYSPLPLGCMDLEERGRIRPLTRERIRTKNPAAIARALVRRQLTFASDSEEGEEEEEEEEEEEDGQDDMERILRMYGLREGNEEEGNEEGRNPVEESSVNVDGNEGMDPEMQDFLRAMRSDPLFGDTDSARLLGGDRGGEGITTGGEDSTDLEPSQEEEEEQEARQWFLDSGLDPTFSTRSLTDFEVREGTVLEEDREGRTVVVVEEEERVEGRRGGPEEEEDQIRERRIQDHHFPNPWLEVTTRNYTDLPPHSARFHSNLKRGFVYATDPIPVPHHQGGEERIQQETWIHRRNGRIETSWDRENERETLSLFDELLRQDEDRRLFPPPSSSSSSSTPTTT
ncbi:WD40 repeat-like protein [Violaceomyces palustris]|uniref:WD40 repeat-like protein n=1 Tax=Violaceomyces palustris TaxID=1673888 RepID=A0ACD0NQN3_9BASI|nr:WD40 repeat-like protein [Violaceomyces palustris]